MRFLVLMQVFLLAHVPVCGRPGRGGDPDPDPSPTPSAEPSVEPTPAPSETPAEPTHAGAE